MKERIDRHKDGSVRAKGHIKDGELEGYWEWFRKDGTKMRSGYFENGKQVGDWTICPGAERVDAAEAICKVSRGRALPVVA